MLDRFLKEEHFSSASEIRTLKQSRKDLSSLTGAVCSSQSFPEGGLCLRPGGESKGR